MSSDLLAEFDSFYKAPQKTQPDPTPASNNLSLLGDAGGYAQPGQASNFSQWHTPAQKPNNDIWGGMTAFQSSPKVQPANGHQRDFLGSFEAAGAQDLSPALPTSKPNHGLFIVDARKPMDQNKPGIVRRPTLDFFSSNVSASVNYPPPEAAIQTQSFPPRPAPITKGSFGNYGDVLFDAADELAEDDDEFGDFETGAPELASQPQPPTAQSIPGMFGATTLKPNPAKRPPDLLSTRSSSSRGLPYPQAPKSPSFQERNPFSELGIATKQVSATKKEERPNSASPITAWPTYEPKEPKTEPYVDSPVPDNDEEWGDFTNRPPEFPALQNAKATSGIEADAWTWDAADEASEPIIVPKQVDVAPPTNIPPPSVILALFTPLFDLSQSILFKAVAKQPFSLKNRIISDPSTIDFLRGYLLIGTVAARIIAGRKLRWKRDTLLFQAMKIGPAAAGGKGGMKLAGVDKAEITREDREAADVVRVWKEQLGRLRSAIAVANSSMHDASTHLAIPDISENMYVKTQEGGLGAPKQCLICGLKREERINKVDVQVEDSFGEWWVEHWGHRACRNFWLEHEFKLKNH